MKNELTEKALLVNPEIWDKMKAIAKRRGQLVQFVGGLAITEWVERNREEKEEVKI